LKYNYQQIEDLSFPLSGLINQVLMVLICQPKPSISEGFSICWLYARYEMKSSNSLKTFPCLSQEEIDSKILNLLESTPKFDIEVSLKCNLKCIMCPREKISRDIRIMPHDLMNRLSDWLPEDNVEIFFCGMGEPTLNKYLTECLKSLSNGKRYIGITSNAASFTPRFIEHLLSTGINFIQISFNSLSKNRYEHIMKGADFESVMRSLKYLSKVKTPSLYVELAYTEQKENKHEADDIRKFAEELGFGFQHNLLHSRGGNLIHDYKKEYRPNSNLCGIFPRRHFISCTGYILACCHDLSGSTVLGHLNQISFAELLEIKRQRILKKEWFDLCEQCDDLTRINDLEL